MYSIKDLQYKLPYFLKYFCKFWAVRRESNKARWKAAVCGFAAATLLRKAHHGQRFFIRYATQNTRFVVELQKPPALPIPNYQT